MLQLFFQNGNAGFDFGLLVFGGVIFAVFGKIAVAARNFDLFRDLAALDCFQLLQLFYQFIVAGLGHLNGICHK